jgi:hypothetical protein
VAVMMTLAPRYFLNPAGSGRSRYLTLVDTWSVARLPSRWLVASPMPNILLFWATSFSAALLILEHLWVELPHALCLLAAPVHDYPVLVVLHHLLDGDRVVFGTEIGDPATRLDD